MHVFFTVLWHIIQFYRLIIVKKGRTHWSAPTVICTFEENSCLAQLLILNDVLPRPDECGDRRDQLHHRERQPDAIDAERQCSEDAIDNPAIGLASFLYDNYLQGRNKFTFLTQKRGRVLGLWIEQLVSSLLKSSSCSAAQNSS